MAVLAAIALVAGLLAAPGGPARGEETGERDYAVTLFGGWMTDNGWREIAALDDVSLRDSWLAGAGIVYEFAGTAAWALEIELQAAKHFGEQTHWEVNLPLYARWRAFPWNDRLPTSLAFGIGPSYATDLPPAEVAMDGSSEQLLLYWTAELELGLPDSPWSGVARLHHRSAGYGLFAESGGSNVLTLGVRRRF